jgi:hypothetical protein
MMQWCTNEIYPGSESHRHHRQAMEEDLTPSQNREDDLHAEWSEEPSADEEPPISLEVSLSCRTMILIFLLLDIHL